jgi:transcriptional regulator with XRE-family HTH domain
MSPIRNPLRNRSLSVSLTAVGVTSRALARIRDAMKEHGVSQRALAERLGCSQGRVAKILKGRIRLTVEDLEQVAKAVGLPLVETIRNRGVEFFAELTPSELKVIEAMRQSPQLQRALSELLSAAIISAKLSDKRLLKRPQASGKNPLLVRESPDGHSVPFGGDPRSLDDLRDFAGKLSLLLGVFASGGNEPPALSAPHSEKSPRR